MTKAEIEARVLAETTYRIQEDFARGIGLFRIDKIVCGNIVKDSYHCRITGEGERATCWCDCPGFHIQKYAKEDHKHIKVLRDFLLRISDAKARGELIPKAADYRFKGSGATTTVYFLRTHLEIPECQRI